MGLSSGLWYPVLYAGGPAIAAAAAFAHVRPSVGPLRLLGVGVWLLVSSILALAVAVVLALAVSPVGQAVVRWSPRCSSFRGERR